MQAIADIHWQVWPVYALIAAVMVSYAWERVSLEITSIAVVIALLLFFYFFPLQHVGTAHLTPAALLSGFANPALISVMALLIIGYGVFLTDALEPFLRVLRKAGSKFPILTLLLLFLFIALTSAFLNNTPVVVMLIPLVGALAMNAGIARSKVMMPVSFLAILGGMTTLIGSSTNILVAESVNIMRGYQISFFDFFIPGLFLTVLGMIYLLIFAPRLLPDRNDKSETESRVPELYTAQIIIDNSHPLNGKQVSTDGIEGIKGVKVYSLCRGGSTLSYFAGVTLQEGDLLVAAAPRERFAALLRENPNILLDASRRDKTENVDANESFLLAEAVVAPGASVLRYGVSSPDFASETGCRVLGVRRPRTALTQRFRNMQLAAGDVLLLLGRQAAIQNLRFHHDILPLEGSSEALPESWRGRHAAWILLATVIFIATGLLPIVVAAMLGVILMLLLGVLSLDEAARAIDRRIYLLIGSALAMSAALQHTGGAYMLATALVWITSALPAWVALSLFFLLVALITNVLSNNATAVLFTPVAIGLAEQLNMNPVIFIHAIIFAANASFLTPIAYQTNLLVMAPGNYRFRDYAKLGAPLLIVIWIGYSFFAPYYYAT
ncbi:MAG: SLC13 family permease [Hyphomicrobiales bacterium]|nr:SLC13 family permease [Hyphomicrobiales bacterium]MCY4049503.1 SLC13 family permease [Hyphomicrobiales bacterium]MCY4053377.1 SLC13 family permease [Hyphomicrobiales bacterium]